MKRRSFLAASAAVGIVGVNVIPEEANAMDVQAGGGGRQVLDLRTYTFASLEKRKSFESFLAGGMIPALKRAGVGPVGVFVMNKADNPEAKFEGDTSLDMFVLLPHPSLESVLTLDAKLAADTAYGKALTELKDGPKEASAYARYESSLLYAFDDCPKVEVPTKAATRVLQLRTYESHNDERSRMKVRMFNQGGEIKIFRAVGLNPIFFGHAFTGTRLPNLTYMVGFENDEAMKAAWGKFGNHPDWQKLREDPLYKDTVSRITNLVLRPSEASQI